MFQVVADMHGDLPWGSFLDAGTGRASMAWLLSLATTRWTAITGAPSMAAQVEREIGARMREQDRLVTGNWTDPDLLAGEQYDTVLADYLLGAMDGFAPYWQDRLCASIAVSSASRSAPYVPYTADSPAGKVVGEIGRLRDACLLLAGERPYREYPMDWVLRHLRSAGFRPLDAQQFPIRYGERFIHSQLDMCVQRLARLRDRSLALALAEHVGSLRDRAVALCQAEGGLRHGFDYVVAAEPVG